MKINRLIYSLFIAIFTLSFLGHTAIADEKAYENIKDGEYDITAKALNETKDEKSGAAGFLSEDAKLSVKDGEVELTITIPHDEMAEITGLQIEGTDPNIDEDDDAKYQTYKLNELKSELNAQVQYEVPSMNMDHDVPFRFSLEGLDELPVQEEEKDEGEPEGDQGNSDDDKESDDESEVSKGESDEDQEGSTGDDESSNNPEKPGNEDGSDEQENENGSEDKGKDKGIDLENGYYTIKTSYLKDESDESSSMGNYMGESVFVSIQDGKVLLTITIDGDETVTKLQVNGQNAVEKKVDGDKRYETFEFDSLDSMFDAYVEYQAPYEGEVFKSNADFRIALDENSVKKSAASEKPGKDVKSDNDKDKEKDKDKNEDKDKNKETDKDKDTDKDTDKNKNKDKNTPLKPEKAYEINYEIKNENGVDKSTADEFFVKPALLLEKDEETFIQLTVKNSNMIKSLRNKYGKDYADVLIVKENGDGSVVVQFKVNEDLSNMLLDMRVVVPGMYDKEHGAILVFDKASKQEIDVGNHMLVPSDNVNGPKAAEGEAPGEPLGGKKQDEKPTDNKTDNNGKTPGKPKFGNGDNDNQTDNGVTKPVKTENPQTGDTSTIILYALLLVGSIIPLAMKFKRRFV